MTLRAITSPNLASQLATSAHGKCSSLALRGFAETDIKPGASRTGAPRQAAAAALRHRYILPLNFVLVASFLM